MPARAPAGRAHAAPRGGAGTGRDIPALLRRLAAAAAGDAAGARAARRLRADDGPGRHAPRSPPTSCAKPCSNSSVGPRDRRRPIYSCRAGVGDRLRREAHRPGPQRRLRHPGLAVASPRAAAIRGRDRAADLHRGRAAGERGRRPARRSSSAGPGAWTALRPSRRRWSRRSPPRSATRWTYWSCCRTSGSARSRRSRGSPSVSATGGAASAARRRRRRGRAAGLPGLKEPVVKVPPAFAGRCIRGGGVAPPSNIARYSRSSRLARAAPRPSRCCAGTFTKGSRPRA